MNNENNDRRRSSRRKSTERRSGKLDNLFQNSISKGYFIDARKESRRKTDRRKDNEHFAKVCLN